MLRGVLQETVISRIENSTDQFVLMDNVTYKNVSVTAVTTKIDQIYIFAMSDSVNIPITCKIDPKKKGIVKIKICVDISVIAVFFKDKSFDIYPIGQIVNQSRPSISPQKSDSVRFSPLAIGISEEEPPKCFRTYRSPPNMTDVVSNAFWYASSVGILLIVADLKGLKIWVLRKISSPPLIAPFEGITNSCMKVHKDLATIYLHSKSQIYSLLVMIKDRKISVNSKLLPIQITVKNPLLQTSMQMHNQKWELAILQKDLILYDQDGNEMKRIPIGENTRAQPNSFAITKHLIYYTNGGRVLANFFINFEGVKSAFLFGQQSVSVLNFEKDVVMCLSGNALTILRQKQAPDELFKNLAKKGDWKTAFEVCGGFDLSIQKICGNLAYEFIRQGNFHKAIEIYKQGNCDLTEIIHRFVHVGKERYALHCAMEAIFDDSPLRSVSLKSLRTIGDLLLSRLSIKFAIFPVFKAWETRCISQEGAFCSPSNLSISPLLQYLKRGDYSKLSHVPGALLFRYFKELRNEEAATKYIGYSHKLDLIKPSLVISQGFASLLTQRKRSMNTTSIELQNNAAIQMMHVEDKTFVMTKERLFANNKAIANTEDYLEFSVLGDDVYLITKNHILVKGRLTPNFDELKVSVVENISPVFSMRAASSRIAVIAIDGKVYIISKDKTETYFGDLVDAAISDQKCVAIDTSGEAFLLENEELKPLYDNHFIKAIATCGNTKYLYFTPKKLLIMKDGVDPIERDIDFNVEYAFSGKHAIFAGQGKMIIADDNGIIEKEYSERVGTIFSMDESKDGVIIVGSAAPPMLVLNEPNLDSKLPLIKDIETIVETYPHEFVLPLFDHPIYRALLQALYGLWSTFEPIDDMSKLMVFIPSMKPDKGSELLYMILKENVEISDDIIDLPAVRKMLIDHKECMSKLSQKQMRMLLQPKKRKVFTGTDLLTERLLQNPVNYVILPPRNVKAGGPITGFSCGHILSESEMETALANLAKYCNERREGAGDKITAQYYRPIIQAQCPRCLLQAVTKDY